LSYGRNGILQTDYRNILKIIKKFYSNLFEKKFDVDREKTIDFLARLDLPKISNEHRNLCEHDITKDEILESFKSMQGGKSPGNDGLGKEFYLEFWDKIGDKLYNSILQSKDEGILAAS
jgi:hypothetical protein